MKAHPELNADCELIDDAAQHVISHPEKYDVMVTTNMFGDIISDEIVGLTGTGGIFGTAELGNSGLGLYDPNQLHNSDEAIVGEDKADPLGLIMAVSMMCQYSLGLNDQAEIIKNVVNKVISAGYSTPDIYFEGRELVGTEKMGDLVVKEILNEDK